MSDNVVVPLVDPLTTILEKEATVKERARRILERLRNQKINLIKAKKFACGNCKTVSSFSSLGFVQDYWYESPHGCMGGDTWHRSKMSLCHLVCPHCNTMNYIYNHSQREAILRYVELCGLGVSEIFAVVFENHPTERNKLTLTQVHPK